MEEFHEIKIKILPELLARIGLFTTFIGIFPRIFSETRQNFENENEISWNEILQYESKFHENLLVRGTR